MASGAEGKKVVGRLTIRVSPDMEGFREEVERKANATAKETKPKVKVDADTDEAKRKIHVIEDEKYGAVVDLDADTKGAEAHIKEATRDRHMTVHVHEDRSGLDRLRRDARGFAREIEKSFNGIGGFTKNLKFPDLVPNIGGLGGFGSIAIIVAGLSLVAPALALLSQALVGLPALISAVALPLGTLALGFGGIKDALQAAGLLDITQKVSKSGKKGKEEKSPGEVIKDLQTQVSDVFKTGLTPVFTQIAGVLPQLTRGLPFVAQGLVKMAEGLGNIVASPAFLAGFDRFTNSVGTMLTNLSPALQLFTSGMMNLITNVGDHLPGLGNQMTIWAGQFQNWVDRISKPQQDWFGRNIPNSSTLDKAIHNIGPELDTLFSSIGNLVNRGLDLAGKGDIAKGIQDAITGLEHLLDQLSRLGPVFESIASILNIVPGFGPGFDPKAPYGTKPGPAGSGTTIPLTHDEAMTQQHGFWDDPGGWFEQEGSKFKDGLKNFFKGIPGAIADNTIGGNLLSMLFGGSTGTANADAAPFNPGTRVNTAPIPVTPVPAGGNLNNGPLNNLLLPQAPPSAVPGATGIGPAGTPLKAPKIEAPKAPEGSDQIWNPLIEATHKAGADINAEVSSWSGKIKSALDSAASGAHGSGVAIGTQLAAGIAEGQAAAVTAAHNLAQAVKDAMPHSPAKTGPFSGSGWTQVKTSGGAIASQFADGLDGGVDGIVAASKRLMDAVHQSMGENGIISPQLTAAVQKESSAISIELDRLKVQRDALDPKDKAGRAAIKSQMDQLRALKDEFGLTGKESKYNSKYGGADQDGPFTAQGIGQMFTQEIASGLNAMLGFGKANVTQLEQDLGMSGNGVVEQLGDYGIQFLSSGLNSLVGGFFGQGGKGGGNTYNFHSRDDDGMMQNYQRTRNFESMAHTQRTN